MEPKNLEFVQTPFVAVRLGMQQKILITLILNLVLFTLLPL